MSRRLLIVDDDPSIRDALVERFRARDCEVSTAGDGAEALELARQRYDVILLDIQIPTIDGLAVLAKLREQGIDSAVIVITAYGTVKKAVEAMSLGAYDFLEKPFTPAIVEATVERALERTQLVRNNQALREMSRGPGFYVADPRMDAAVTLAQKAARSPSTVLLLGESGTGKEMLARQIHEWSDRVNGPFLAVNCVALAESLLESELFGHERGSFTGASERRIGKLELADGGTLFLDEIGDISAGFQAKLLRFLQERAFERVGGNSSIAVNVRVIAATNRDLKKMATSGEFREDLFYRLNVISVDIPPLRDRPADIDLLADKFVIELAAELKRPQMQLGLAARSALRAYKWPGNVRELRNALERAVALAEGTAIEPIDLPPDVLLADDTRPAGGFHEAVEQFRKQIIRDALARANGNQTAAAKELGLQRTYLARLIRNYGLR